MEKVYTVNKNGAYAFKITSDSGKTKNIKDNLNELNKDEKWILKTLKSKNIKKVKDVLIFMIDENDDIFIQRKKE